MFGLPQSTVLNKPLPKKALFDKFKPNPADRKLFDEQISRLAIVAEISPQTVSVAASGDVTAVYFILVTLKTSECNQKNIALLSKLIDQSMVFALHYEDRMRLAVFRSERVLLSESKKIDDWQLNLRGFDLGAVWDNLIADMVSINLEGGKVLDEIIVANERKEKLIKQIATLEKKAMNERQPRRRWDMANEIRKLKAELEEI